MFARWLEGVGQSFFGRSEPMSESRINERNGASDGGAYATKASREERRERWRGLVEEHRSSGESKRAFCRRRGISYHRFLAWAKRFGSGRVGVDERHSMAANTFREVRVGAPGVFAFPVSGAVYEIASGGVVVRVASGFDEGEVARLLRAVLEATGSLEERTRPFGGAARRPVDETSRSVGKVARPSNGAARPTDKPARPTDGAARPIDKAAHPVDETSRSVGKTAGPINEAARPSNGAARPIDKAARPVAETGRSSGNAIGQTGDTRPATVGAVREVKEASDPAGEASGPC